MVRLPVACAVAVTLAGCGSNAVQVSATPSPLPSVGTLRMLKPPIVVYDEKEGLVGAYLRLNRQIEDRDLSGDRVVSFEGVAGDSLFGVHADVRFPTCYSDLFEAGASFTAGQRLPIELKLGSGQGMKATATVELASHDTHPERELGCPRDPDGHVCSGKLDAKYLTIRPESAYATSCNAARKVLIRVGRWANPHRCPEALCVSKHRMNRGFRCDAYFDNGGEGFPAWQIVCKRGRAELTAFADESYKG